MFEDLPKDGKCPVNERLAVILKAARGNTFKMLAGDVDWTGIKGWTCTSTHILQWRLDNG